MHIVIICTGEKSIPFPRAQRPARTTRTLQTHKLNCPILPPQDRPVVDSVVINSKVHPQIHPIAKGTRQVRSADRVVAEATGLHGSKHIAKAMSVTVSEAFVAWSLACSGFGPRLPALKSRGTGREVCSPGKGSVNKRRQVQRWQSFVSRHADLFLSLIGCKVRSVSNLHPKQTAEA